MQPPARRETSEVAKFGHYGATRRDETRLFPVGSRAQHSSSCGGVAAPLSLSFWPDGLFPYHRILLNRCHRRSWHGVYLYGPLFSTTTALYSSRKPEANLEAEAEVRRS
jgi:hypothetical protein